MTIMKDLVVSTYTSRQCLQAPASVCAWVVCVCLCGYGRNAQRIPFKYLLIRPSTPFLLSCSVLFHSTPNYFNPLIAQRAPGLRVYRDRYCWGDECVWKCGHISHHWGLITGPSAPRALQFWPAVGSTGVTLPKIRCQGIFHALVSIPARPPDSLVGLLGGLKKVWSIYRDSPLKMWQTLTWNRLCFKINPKVAMTHIEDLMTYNRKRYISIYYTVNYIIHSSGYACIMKYNG